MKHRPATTLPSDDEPWWATVEEFHGRFSDLVIRARDWEAAEQLANEYFERASSAYEAAIYAGSRAIVLSFLGHHEAALEADKVAESLVPGEPEFKISVARRLIADLGRPEEGLLKLAEAEPLLEPNARAHWLSEKALGLLALGRDAEAVDCFREIAKPERLAGMRQWNYIGLVDFRLVTAYMEKGLAPELCAAYLEAAEAIAERHNPDRLEYVRKLLTQAREAGA